MAVGRLSRVYLARGRGRVRVRCRGRVRARGRGRARVLRGGLLPCALERRLAAEAARLEHVLRGAMEHQRRARPAHTGHPHLVRVRVSGVGC